MSNLQVIALIIVALVILAVIIAYRKKLVLMLRFFGINLSVEAENEPQQRAAAPPAGVRLKDAKASEGGLLIEEGRSETGTGIDVEGVEVKDDIVIGKGGSGTPKTDPPA
jgi:hypothetical protein